MNEPFVENAYSPFPWKMRGRFFQRVESGKTRFFEIYAIRYDLALIERYVKINSLKESNLGILIELVGQENIGDETYFLYKLQTYMGDPSISDEWEFVQHIKDYCELGFSSFAKLEDFCKKEWMVDVFDFLPIDETNIPH